MQEDRHAIDYQLQHIPEYDQIPQFKTEYKYNEKDDLVKCKYPPGFKLRSSTYDDKTWYKDDVLSLYNSFIYYVCEYVYCLPFEDRLICKHIVYVPKRIYNAFQKYNDPVYMMPTDFEMPVSVIFRHGEIKSDNYKSRKMIVDKAYALHILRTIKSLPHLNKDICSIVGEYLSEYKDRK